MPDQNDIVFEALNQRFADCGGYGYDDPEDMDETGAPWISNCEVGISLDPDGSNEIVLDLPSREVQDVRWGWELRSSGRLIATGTIAMTWQEWDRLEKGPNAEPYRIGGKAAGELEAQLRDAAAEAALLD